MTDPVFLGLDEILALHADQIRRYGGRHGIRDLELVQSAVAMPETTFADRYLHTSLAEMAAAYLYHLVANHAFVDGNERIGLVAALVFLQLNDLALDARPEALFELVMGMADGTVGKAQIAVFLEEHARPR